MYQVRMIVKIQNVKDITFLILKIHAFPLKNKALIVFFSVTSGFFCINFSTQFFACHLVLNTI